MICDRRQTGLALNAWQRMGNGLLAKLLDRVTSRDLMTLASPKIGLRELRIPKDRGDARRAAIIAPMGLRYRKRIALPFGRLNLSRSGASVSIGRPGAWLTLSHGRRRATLGWPGSGLSYTSVSKAHSAAPARPARPARPISGWAWLLLLIVAALVWHLAAR